jgi:hypothetical protein
LPAHAQFDLWDRDHRHGVKLYVQRVFIMEGAEQLVPAYLRFVRGVIDSNDLPLNVSREILQESKTVEAIRAGSVKRVLSLLEELAENRRLIAVGRLAAKVTAGPYIRHPSHGGAAEFRAGLLQFCAGGRPSPPFP